MISQRLSNMKIMDKILVLKDGRVLEQGSHEQLISQHNEYYQLYTIQSSKYKEDMKAY
jgi:ATP-binding cassette subfamily B protein